MTKTTKKKRRPADLTIRNAKHYNRDIKALQRWCGAIERAMRLYLTHPGWSATIQTQNIRSEMISLLNARK